MYLYVSSIALSGLTEAIEKARNAGESSQRTAPSIHIRSNQNGI